MNNDFLLMKVNIHKRYTDICVYMYGVQRGSQIMKLAHMRLISCEEDQLEQRNKKLKVSKKWS